MQLRTVLILTLAAACLTTTARSRKKKNTTNAAAVVKQTPAVEPAVFSYAMGVAQSTSLKNYLIQREGVDSAHIEAVVRALNEAATLTDDQIKEKQAYAAGLRIARMNREQVVASVNQTATGKADTTYTDLATFTRGLTDGLGGRATLTADSANNIVEQQVKHFHQGLQLEGIKYLAENRKKEGWKETASGLQYHVLQQGTGAQVNDTCKVEVNYEGKLIDGTIFDSSYQRGKTATFSPKQVIKGWTEALKMMREGDIYELAIPYELGYGERGAGQNIPPYATLLFKVELVKVINGK